MTWVFSVRRYITRAPSFFDKTSEERSDACPCFLFSYNLISGQDFDQNKITSILRKVICHVTNAMMEQKLPHQLDYLRLISICPALGSFEIEFRRGPSFNL